MKPITQRRRIVLALIVCLLSITQFCCRGAFGPVRETMFPPDFTYMPPERVQTAMWVLAAEIQHLEQVLKQPTGVELGSQRFEVERSLERMSAAARTLDEPGRQTQHPVLNQNLGNFLDRIERAKRAIVRDPPSYFQASTLAGSCYLCHGSTNASATPRSNSVDTGR